LQSDQPPAWFIEKLGKDLEMDPALAPSLLNPESPLVKEAWEEFRQEAMKNAEEGEEEEIAMPASFGE